MLKTTETPFDPATLVITANDIRSLARADSEVLVWDHSAGEVLATTRQRALASGLVAFTDRAWINDWTRDDACWNDDHTEVTPECANLLAGVLTEWLRSIA